jgi:hypothetical protein
LDDPEPIVHELGRGRVQFYRQPENVGSVRNFETCLQRSTGELVHILHGDDRVRDSFYARMQQPFLSRKEIGLAFCRHIYIDSKGAPVGRGPIGLTTSGFDADFVKKMAIHNRIQPPTVVVRREVYEVLGGFDRRLTYCEDWEMWMRIATRYPVWQEAESLAEYRLHSQSNSGRHIRSAAMLPDLRRAMDIISEELAPDASTIRRSKAWHARSAIVLARDLARLGRWPEAKAIASTAFEMSPSLITYAQAIAHFFQVMLEKLYLSPEARRARVDRKLSE